MRSLWWPFFIFQKQNGDVYCFEITIDCTPPTATLQGVSDGGETREDVVISEWSDDAILQVFLNDTEIDYILGDPLTESGTYRIVVTDLAGNSTTYNFTIDKSMSVGGIVAISAGSVTLVAGIVLWILKRRGVI